MKKILLTLTAGLISCSVFGQGGVVMNTRGTGVSAPATDIVTGQLAAGTGYYAQLFYGAVGGVESAMLPTLSAPGGAVAALANFGTGTSAGFITTGSGGGNRYVDPAVVAYGANTAFQIRAWSAVLGTDWNTALNAWQGGSNPGAVLGRSAIVTQATSPLATVTPPFMTTMAAFTLVPVPEPSVIALGAIGLVALLWRRRK